MDRDVPAEKTLFIGQRQRHHGYEQVTEKMAKDLGGKGNIVVLTGLKGSSPAVDRNKGMEIDVYALNYNKKLFAEAGIAGGAEDLGRSSRTPPTKLTKKEAGQQGFGMINSWAAGVVHPFASLLVSNGGDLVVDGKPALDSKQAGETFELYEKLIKSGATDPGDGDGRRQHHRAVPRQFRLRQDRHDHHGQLVGSGAEGRHGRQVRRYRHRADPGRPERRQAALDLLFVDDGRQCQGAGEAEQKAAWDFLAWLNGPNPARTAPRRWPTS